MFFGNLNIVFGNDLKKAEEAFNRGDFKTTLAYLKPLAEKGDVRGQFYLGYMYERGHGVSRNEKEAVR